MTLLRTIYQSNGNYHVLLGSEIVAIWDYEKIAVVLKAMDILREHNIKIDFEIKNILEN